MKVILLRGIAASGKSTLAHEIAKHTKALIWSKDTIFDTCLSLGVEWETANKISYDYLYNLIDHNKDNDCTLILDVGLHKNEYAQKVVNYCKENSVEIRAILTTCGDVAEWRRRFEVRAKDPAPNQTITDFDEMSEYCGGMEVKLLEGEMLLDSAGDTQAEVEKVLEFIK